MVVPPFRCDSVFTAVGGPFNFAAAPGACLTFMGPSGVGKSLLLRALADLDPHRGEVFLGDLSQSACPPHDWRRQVAYVPAAAGWWAETVAEHFGDLASLTDDLVALGLPPECGAWPVARLSSGERQRLSLLRAVALHSPVLLLDEPTANLDADTSLAVEPPALIRGYLRLGAKVLGAPAWDPDFNSADLPMLMRIADLPSRYRKHFLGA